MIRRVPTKQRNASIKYEPDRSTLMRLGFLLFCGLVVTVGFVYAGGQHFAALKLGYQTEDLRRVRAQLEAEQRRIMLAREAAASPARLERAARELGMQALQSSQIDPLKRTVADQRPLEPTQSKKLAPAPSANVQKETTADKARKNRVRNKPI